MEDVALGVEKEERVLMIMDDQFARYIVRLYQDVPSFVYVGLAVALCVGLIVFFVFLGFRNGWRKVLGLMLVEYVFLILCSTVFFRTVLESRGYDFTPFWSYAAILGGRTELLAGNIMNVVAFVPVGVLLGCTFRNMSWWKAVMIGVFVSVSVETMQYLFHRGFAETDDVMHNTAGCILGYMLVKSLWLMVKDFKQRRIAG